MKNILSLICILGRLALFAQEEIPLPNGENQDSVLSLKVVEQLPVFSGCEDYKNEEKKAQMVCFQRGVIRFVSMHYKFPESARRRGIGAKILISFVIEKDASVSNIEIVSSAKSAHKNANSRVLKIAEELDQAAIDVIKQLRFKEPALLNEKPVRMGFTLPINGEIN